MPLKAVTPGTYLSNPEEESYIESPTLTQADDSGDNLENDEEIAPEDASGACNISENTENHRVKVSAEHMLLGGSAIEAEILKVYRTVLDGDRAMSERKDAFRQLLRETDGKAYNRRELAATFLLTVDVLESDILDKKEEIFALLKLLQHQDENVRTLAFDQLPFLIPRCIPSALDYAISVVVQNLRKSLATCTWSSPSEAKAIQGSALYLAGRHPGVFFNEIFPDATGTHHDPLKWLSENYSTLKTTTFIEHPEAEEELIRVMEKCGSRVAEEINKCIGALECSVGILEIWKGLVRVPGDVGIALLGTWLGGSPREFLGYWRKGSSETLAVASRKESSSPSVKEGTPPATKMEVSPSYPSSTSSSKSKRSLGSHVKATPTRNAEIPSYKHQHPAPINTKRKFTSYSDQLWRRGRRQSTYTGPTTAPLPAPFSRGSKRRRYDSFRPGSPRYSGSRSSTNDNPQKENRGHSHTPIVRKAGVAIVCNQLVPEKYQHNRNQDSHRSSHSQYQYNTRRYSSSIPSPTPPPPKTAFGYQNNMPLLLTPPFTATWQRPIQGQSPGFPHGGYEMHTGGEGSGGGRNECGSRGQDMWKRGSYGGGPSYMGYQHRGRWFSSYSSGDRYLGEAGKEGNQPLIGTGADRVRVRPKSPGTLKITTPSEMGGDTTVGSESGNMATNDSAHSWPPALSPQPLHMPLV
ncbi:hypothetical protein BGX38DRAFT_1200661 [Terfezia claveryi]|nr:hypothetical protein BGX38DRAFT_1200661 [Terfezia claveryi]